MLEEVVSFKKKIPIWAIIFAAFAIVSFWRGVWGLMDLYLFPGNEILSLSVSVIIGLVVLWLIRRVV